MQAPFPIAIAQCEISPDVRQNGMAARDAMRQAARDGARLIHFPEAALSGYVKAQITDWAQVDWALLAGEQDSIATLARDLGVCVVMGSNQQMPAPSRPCNSLLVISDLGEILARYDKRYCSHTEISAWYSAGTAPVVFAVDGVHFGCALCIEVCFPNVFSAYERLGVDCVLLSSYSQDPIHAVMARAHAATNCYWLSMAVPAPCSHRLQSSLIGPDGSVVAACGEGRAEVLTSTLDPAASQFAVALNHARPWRARALLGDIYIAGTGAPPSSG